MSLFGRGAGSGEPDIFLNTKTEDVLVGLSVKAFVSAMCLIAAMTNIASAQSEGPGRALVASNVLRLSADTLRTGQFITKEFIVPHAGIVRLRYQFRSDGTGTVSVSAGTSIDQNNSCSASTSSTAFQAKVCDIRVVAGDRLRVSGSSIMDPETFLFPNVSLRFARVSWNVVNASSTGAVLAD
jgi:hypothetical protein